MKERPILFSAPMVRAILDGRKTQTRRVVKLKNGQYMPPSQRADTNGWAQMLRLCPYGQSGDRLWGRETFKAIASGEVKNGYGEVRYGVAYQADGATRWNERPTIIHDLTGQPPTGHMQFKPVPWKPSIHMPRRHSRILLEITAVWVERLQGINRNDAIAEGLDVVCDGRTPYGIKGIAASWNSDPCESYRVLWESINGLGSWAANPWVWVIEFKRVAP